MFELPEELPFHLTLSDESDVEITEEMVSRNTQETVVNGEYFTPHVIEPAFGIDRIIWHVLDHNFRELQKEDESYTILTLNHSVAPYDVAILPLFDKQEMVGIAREISNNIRSVTGIIGVLDTSRSIGRRYARADEIGIPWAVTVDHQSIEDGSVTIRRRDDQKQVRSDVDSLIDLLSSRSLSTLF